MVKKIRIWVGKGELIPPNSIVKLTYEFKIVSAWAGVGIFSLKVSCPSYRQKENFLSLGRHLSPSISSLCFLIFGGNSSQQILLT